eukprot:scaffold32241_cov14-Tisochrysis_lutea.AAC.1
MGLVRGSTGSAVSDRVFEVSQQLLAGCPSNVMHLMPHAYICAHTRLYQQLPSLKHYNASMAVDAEN